MRTYANLLKEIKAKVSPVETGVDIRSIKKTKHGGVLLEMARKTEESKAFTDAVKAATANIGTVKTLTPTTTIEILDLDEISTESEVCKALKREFTDSLEVKRVNLTKPTPRGNLNRCALAQNLLRQRVFEDKTDVCFICEQYLNIEGKTWFADETGTAAIWIVNTKNVTRKWNAKRLDLEAFKASLARSWSILQNNPTSDTCSETEKAVLNTMKEIAAACDASMPRLKNQSFHRPAYWW
ncbi:Protein of unknown function [Cotesia congregata]|uniref:Uncharacterized protein n=1 Tax=Cotesia congregata TaxID=51543 RepID=A0A8J2GZ96_COTCN|nr:Protein of unknown function [Cotesia congregata]